MNRLFSIFLVNFLVSYVGIVLVNLVFDYRDFSQQELNSELREIESRAREADKKYYHSCLADSSPQLFFPNLLTYKSWLDLARKHQFLPLGSQPNTSVSYCNEGYGLIQYRTDQFGFRNSEAIWESKPDILIIGDSFMAGACVPNNKHIAPIINKTTNLKAITVGTGSNGPQHYFALIEKFIPMIVPRFAVLSFYPNDNSEINDDNIYILKAGDREYDGYDRKGLSEKGVDFYKAASERITRMERQKKYSRICDMQHDYYLQYNELTSHVKQRIASKFDIENLGTWLTKNASTKGLIRIFSLEFTRKTFFPEKFLDPVQMNLNYANELPLITRRSIDALFDKCQDICLPVILLVPNSNHWRPDSRAGEYFNQITKYVANTSNVPEYVLLDGRESISSNNLDNFSPTGPHLSISGYQKIADMFIDEVIRKGIDESLAIK